MKTITLSKCKSIDFYKGYNAAVTAANKTRIIAIGDIHGCYYTLRELLKKLNINYETDFLVFLGDYIDRGSWPLKTIKYLRTISKKHPDSIVCLKGNHEDMCYRYYYNEPYSKNMAAEWCQDYTGRLQYDFFRYHK